MEGHWPRGVVTVKNLIVIGASGMGREIYMFAKLCRGFGSLFTVKGFLDDRPHLLDGYHGYGPILGTVEEYPIQESDVFVCALGDPQARKKYAELIEKRGGRLQTLLHERTAIYATTTVGEGCIVEPDVHISTDVKIGRCTVVFGFTTIGHDALIGDYCHLGSTTFVGGHVVLGECVTLHPGAKIIPHKRIGAGATIGAGSVVLRDVKPGATVFGVPAVPLP
jgi:sugar O-acyltransferase (sialic acid O-acetyltransferase NeuD family)